jgi:high-affinity iron transporter
MVSVTLRALLLAVVLPLAAAGAQEHPAKRLSSIVSVATEEYGKAVDATGKLVSDLEYQEAVDFLADAKLVAARLSGERAANTRLILDSLAAAVTARRPPAEVVALHARFTSALGTEGALDMPARSADLAQGQSIYRTSCASCHGNTAMGDGPASVGMNPAPPALGSAELMADVSPALMYRIVSVGVTGTAMPAFAGTLTPEQRWNVVGYLTTLRSTPAHVLEGEGLYLQRCASCHGASGEGDGPNSRALTRLPPELGSLAWQVERSDARIAQIIKHGIPGSAMPPSRDLPDSDVVKIVAHVRTLPSRSNTVQQDSESVAGKGAAAAPAVMRLLDDALTLARAGRTNDATDRAFDAYIAFEPLETPARAKSPGLVASMERHFAEFKGALKAKDLRSAEKSRNAIEAGLPSVVELTRRTTGFWGAFFQSFLIILREGFEAILVIGAIVAFLLKTGNKDRLRQIWIGTGFGLAASAVTAIVLQTVLRAIPASRELIEGGTMLIAVVILFSVSYWLISKVEAAKWQQFIREKRRRQGARVCRVPRRVSRGCRNGAVLSGAVWRRTRCGTATDTGDARGLCGTRSDFHVVLPLRRPHPLAAILCGYQRVAVLHGVSLCRERRSRVAGRQRHAYDGDPGIPAH